MILDHSNLDDTL